MADPIHRGRAFGVTLESEAPLPGLAAAAGGDGPHVSWRRISSSELPARRRNGEARSLVDLRHADGRLFLGIQEHGSSGYLVRAPGYGSHLVSRDGRSILSAPAGRTRRWQRLFFSQVVPLAAAACGLDPFHAGAVAVDGAAFAFAAPPGTGKTSILVHLVGLGAEFISDDILALEPGEGTVLAHPGAATASVDAAELRSLPRVERRRLVAGVWARDDGKVQIDVPAPAGTVPLRGIFFLGRGRGATRLTVRREQAPARRILGAAFLPHFRPPDRLETHLAVSAAVAGSVSAYSVEIPRALTARRTAAALLDRLAEEAAA